MIITIKSVKRRNFKRFKIHMRFDKNNFNYDFRTSETEYENDDLSHAQVAKIEEQIQLPGEHSRHSRYLNYYSTERGFSLINSLAIYTCIMYDFWLSTIESGNVG